VRLQVDTAPTGRVVADADRLAQIAANLLENALRSTPEAGTVRLGTRRDGDTVVVEVADSGSGIDPADLPHVFDRFYVAKRYRRVRPEGSGLGLAIVNQLAGAMGADVTVTSTDSGTTFAVRLASS
jgi:two-component system, OmpR family, sensor histidine kinase BaeS